MRVRFGDCVLDTATRELTRSGTAVHVSPKAFQFLELLLSERPRAIAKDEIHDRLWPGTFVSDGTLTSLAAELRSAIGDDAHEPRFVRTVHRFGYAFSGEARQEAAAPVSGAVRFAWRLLWGLREIALEEGDCILGRDAGATILVDHKSVSRQHARIRISPAGSTLEDLGSKNGTSLRGAKITGPATLSDGDEIRIGSVPMTFRVISLPESTETAAERPPAGRKRS
jgi:DNA-binding winged helix-turn-helix (wHTH) protein